MTLHRAGQFHGGDDAAARRWPDAPAPILDLSTGINPFSYPFDTPSANTWRRLPQTKAENAAKQAIAAYLGIADVDTLVLAPGSQLLINQLPFLFDPSDVSVSTPTYGEHATSWARAGHRIASTEIRNDLHNAEAFAVVVNPNNPTGHRIGRDTLIEIAERKRGTGQLLVVDEAFADLAPDIGAGDLVQDLPVVVFRSSGKFFGLAGLRLGIMIAASDLCARMRERLGPWAVSGPALEIATRAYADAAWIAATRTRLKKQAAGLDRILTAVGLDVIGGTDLFRLVAHAKAPRVYEGLGARGILVRSFDYNETWLRVGLPPDKTAAERLASALEEVLSNV